MIQRVNRQLDVLLNQRKRFDKLTKTQTYNQSQFTNYITCIQSVSMTACNIAQSYTELLTYSQIKMLSKSVSQVITELIEKIKELNGNIGKLTLDMENQCKKIRTQHCSICMENIHQANIKEAKLMLEKQAKQNFHKAVQQVQKLANQPLFTTQENTAFDEMIYLHLAKKQKVLNINCRRMQQFIDVINTTLDDLSKLQELTVRDEKQTLNGYIPTSKIGNQVSDFLKYQFSQKAPAWIHKLFLRLMAWIDESRASKLVNYGVQTITFESQDAKELRNLKKELQKIEKQKEEQVIEIMKLKECLKKMEQHNYENIASISSLNRQLTQLKSKPTGIQRQPSSNMKSSQVKINSKPSTIKQLSPPSQQNQQMAINLVEQQVIKITKKRKNQGFPIIRNTKFNNPNPTKNKYNNSEMLQTDSINQQHKNTTGISMKIVKEQKSNRNVYKSKNIHDAADKNSQEFNVSHQSSITKNGRDLHKQTRSSIQLKKSTKHLIDAKRDIYDIKLPPPSHFSQLGSKFGILTGGRSVQQISVTSSKDQIEATEINLDKEEEKSTPDKSQLEQKGPEQKKHTNQLQILRKVSKNLHDQIIQKRSNNPIQKKVFKLPLQNQAFRKTNLFPTYNKNRQLPTKEQLYLQLQLQPQKIQQKCKSKQKQKEKSKQQWEQKYKQKLEKYKQKQNNRNSSYHCDDKKSVENQNKIMRNSQNSRRVDISRIKINHYGNQITMLEKSRCSSFNDEENQRMVFDAFRNHQILSDGANFQAFTSVLAKLGIFCQDGSDLGYKMHKGLSFSQKINKQKIQTDEDPQTQIYKNLFLSKGMAYKFQQSMTKTYHKKRMPQLSRQQREYCSQLFNLLHQCKKHNKQKYQYFCSILRYPYQTLYNQFDVVNFVTQMSFDTFQYFFRKIAWIHRKCDRYTSICFCQHVELVKLELTNIEAKPEDSPQTS